MKEVSPRARAYCGKSQPPAELEVEVPGEPGEGQTFVSRDFTIREPEPGVFQVRTNENDQGTWNTLTDDIITRTLTTSKNLGPRPMTREEIIPGTIAQNLWRAKEVLAYFIEGSGVVGK